MSRATVSDLQQGMAGVRRQSGTDTKSIDWTIPGIQSLVDRLGICECRRRLLHMLPGLLPVVLSFIPHRDPWGLPLLFSVLVLMSGIFTFAITRELDFARRNETNWNYTVEGYGLPVVVTLFLLPGRSELGLMVLGIVAFGDGSATLGGKLMGGRQLPWNRNKTWAGLGCFLLAGTTMASFNYWIEARPHVEYGVALCIAAVAALTAAIAESLPIRSHDNLRVGTTAAITGLGMHFLLLGW